MNYSITKFINPLNRDEQKFYAVPAWNSEVDVRTIANSISKMCTLTPIDIMAVLEAFIQILPDYLMAGNPIKLGDFGTIKLSFKSNGQEKEDDVTASDIKNTKVLFRAGKQLKATLRDVKFTNK